MVTQESINTLREELSNLTAPASREVSKQRAIRDLLPVINDMRSRGFTIKQIAEALSSRAMDISASTLKNYLHRCKPIASASGESVTRQLASPAVTTSRSNPEPRRERNLDPTVRSSSFKPSADTDQL